MAAPGGAGETMEQVRIEAYKQAFLSRERGVRAARVLFDYYVDAADSRGYVRRSKSDIAADLNVSPRTVANYIYTLCALGLIKRKYDGRTVLNPDYYYTGDGAALDTIKRDYAGFTSDDIKGRYKK